MRAECIVCSGWWSINRMSNDVIARIAFCGQKALQF